MRRNRLWDWTLAGIAALALTPLFPLSARAADNGGWDDDWAYFDREDAFAYPEPAPSPKPDNVCLSGVNHHDSPCDCPPIVPVEYPDLPDVPMVCEHPFEDDERFWVEFARHIKDFTLFSKDVPMTQHRGECECDEDGHMTGCYNCPCGLYLCEGGHSIACYPCGTYYCSVPVHVLGGCACRAFLCTIAQNPAAHGPKDCGCTRCDPDCTCRQCSYIPCGRWYTDQLSATNCWRTNNHPGT